MYNLKQVKQFKINDLNLQKKDLIEMEIDDLFNETLREIKSEEELARDEEVCKRFMELSDQEKRKIRERCPMFIDMARNLMDNDTELYREICEEILSKKKEEQEKEEELEDEEFEYEDFEEEDFEEEEEKTPKARWVRKKRERDLPPEIMD